MLSWFGQREKIQKYEINNLDCERKLFPVEDKYGKRGKSATIQTLTKRSEKKNEKSRILKKG